MLSFFRLKKTQRKNAQAPVNKITWAKHGVSEFIGTIMLSMMLAGLSMVVTKDGKVIEAYMLHPILVGFYAGFIAVGLVLVIFLRWSCDLNPMVTITRMINGTNSYKYGFYKIAIQFTAGIVTGLMIYGFGHINSTTSNHAIDAIAVSKKSFLFNNGVSASVSSGGLWIFFIEMVMGSILLFPIFSPNIKDKYRDLMIMFVISMSVWMGLLGGTAAINPARGLSQQVPGLFFGRSVGGAASANSLIVATVSMLIGNLTAPFFYLLVQGFSKDYLNPALTKMIEFKNHKAKFMK